MVALREDRKFSTLAPFGGFAFIAACSPYFVSYVPSLVQIQQCKSKENNKTSLEM